METAQYLFQAQSIPGMLKIELISGSHNWPESPILSNELGFLYLSCQAPDILASAKSELKVYCQHQHARIDTLKKQGDLLKAAMVTRNMSGNAPFNRDQTFTSSYNDLKADSNYFSQLNPLQNCLKFEINARQPYLDAFMKKDSLKWKNEIRTIDEKIKSEQNAEKLDKIVAIYHMLEPENPYVPYFSAFPYFWKGNIEAAVSMLKKAEEAGFSDRARLQNDFPESITSKLQ